MTCLSGKGSEVQGSTFPAANGIKNRDEIKVLNVFWAFNSHIGDDESGRHSCEYAQEFESSDKIATLNP
jgi:hypothetical protein